MVKNLEEDPDQVEEMVAEMEEEKVEEMEIETDVVEREADHMTVIEEEEIEEDHQGKEVNLRGHGIGMGPDQTTHITKAEEEIEREEIDIRKLIEMEDIKIERIEEKDANIHQKIEINQDLQEEEEIETLQDPDHHLLAKEITEINLQEIDLQREDRDLIDQEEINLLKDQITLMIK